MSASAETERTEAAKPRLRAVGRAAFPFGLLVVILLVAWSCLIFPQDTLNELADPSWAAVLIHAQATGMQFGHDLVFTYGPLGFLSVACFSPDIALVRMGSEVALALVISTGLCLVAWRMTAPWRVLMLAFFILVATPLHWGGAAMFLDLGIFVWGLLCFLESNARLNYFAPVLTALVVAGALIKFTFLVSGTFTVGLLVCDLILRGKAALAAVIVFGSVAAFLAAWVLLGQHVSGLGAFLASSYTMADGYNQAMGRQFVNLAMLGGMTLATLAAIVIRCFGESSTVTRTQALRRLLLVTWVAGLLFLNWKYIAVRGDYYHLKLVFGFMPLVALCAEAIPDAGQRAVNWSRVALFASLFLAAALIHNQVSTVFFPFKCVTLTCKSMTTSLGVLTHPSQYVREKTAAFRAEQQREQLPKIRAAVGRATVDVFGQSQAAVFANGLNYRPRPIFKSYFAYNRPMMARNEQYYLSPDAPEYVLFRLEPIDDRFPPLEDAWVLRHLFINYTPLFTEGEFVLLKKVGSEPAHLTLLREGVVRAGENIDWPDERTANLWLEIEPRPTLLGKLRQFFYKPQDWKLVLPPPSKNAAPEKFNAPAAMLAGGFIVHPRMVNAGDVMKGYAGEKTAALGSCSLELAPSLLNTWQTEIPYRLYRIDNQFGAIDQGSR